jgi:hypothetical protein
VAAAAWPCSPRRLPNSGREAADYCGVGDGEEGCVNCTSGVAAGEGDGAGEFNLSEEGAGINDSRELLAALDVAVGFAVGGGGASASVGGGPDEGGVASTWMERDFGRGVGVTST